MIIEVTFQYKEFSDYIKLIFFSFARSDLTFFQRRIIFCEWTHENNQQRDLWSYYYHNRTTKVWRESKYWSLFIFPSSVLQHIWFLLDGNSYNIETFYWKWLVDSPDSMKMGEVYNKTTYESVFIGMFRKSINWQSVSTLFILIITFKTGLLYLFLFIIYIYQIFPKA